ncbi:MAG: hypothetical protein AB7T06_16240 [Kofleriaceae bacterium]
MIDGIERSAEPQRVRATVGRTDRELEDTTIDPGDRRLRKTRTIVGPHERNGCRYELRRREPGSRLALEIVERRGRRELLDLVGDRRVWNMRVRSPVGAVEQTDTLDRGLGQQAPVEVIELIASEQPACDQYRGEQSDRWQHRPVQDEPNLDGHRASSTTSRR